MNEDQVAKLLQELRLMRVSLMVIAGVLLVWFLTSFLGIRV